MITMFNRLLSYGLLFGAVLVIGQGCTTIAPMGEIEDDMALPVDEATLELEESMNTDEAAEEMEMGTEEAVDESDAAALLPPAPEPVVEEVVEEAAEDVLEEVVEETAAEVAEEVAAEPGVFADYTEELRETSKGDIVLFFHAAWCSTCRALERDIQASLSDIPSDLTILKIDYDSERDLRRQYGVTQQHTLIQVNTAGNKIHQWVGGNTLESIIGQVK